MTFFSRNLQIFKRAGLPLYVLTLVYTSLDQLLTINIDESLRSPTGAMGMVWSFGFFSLLLGILFPILGVLVVIYGATSTESSEKGLLQFIRKFFSQVSVEILRSWGKTLLWSLLLFIPGIWKYIQYTLIPFVVTLSPGYQAGRQDALQYSSAVVRHHLWRVLGILLVFHLLIPSVLTVFFDDYRLVWNTPLSALLLTLVDVYFFIFSTQLLMMVFEADNSSQDCPRQPEMVNAAAHV